MTDKHPYTSGQGAVVAIINQLRKTFPSSVDASTLKKFGIAPNNETYIIGILRYLRIIDEEGKKNPEAAKVFVQHEEGNFQKGFAKLVRDAYGSLFELYGEEAWTATIDQLIQFFRGADQTSDIVGRRQANTFQTLSIFSGKLDAELPKAQAGKSASANGKSSSRSAKKTPKVKVNDPPAASMNAGKGSGASSGATKNNSDMALTVRIEINLPANGDKATYDNIFKSLHENLIKKHHES